MKLKHNIITLIIALFTTSLVGCAGAYGDFYHEVNIAKIPNKRKEPKTIVVNTLPTQDTVNKYNLTLLGYSAFIGGYSDRTTIDCATTQGENVGADLVVVMYPKELSSQTLLVPVYHTANVNTTTQTNNNGSFSGSWDSNYSYGTYNGNYNGNSTSSSTSTIEYYTNEYRTFIKYRFHALYFERNNQ
ncbi:MAG: hypothetical protein M0R17_00940 [Candidatus Omnitrophica bacterium]|jgi:hypothetical protein|nr:hypothetical protein [Candidatus Omnitrophota bacterium]